MLTALAVGLVVSVLQAAEASPQLASLALAVFLILLTLAQLRLTRASELGQKGR